MTLPPITILATHEGTWIASDQLSRTTASAQGKYEALSRLHSQMIERGASLVERRIKFIPHRPDGGAVKRFMALVKGRAA